MVLPNQFTIQEPFYFIFLLKSMFGWNADEDDGDDDDDLYR